MRERFDLVIVGSGAGGAPIAHTLAQAGKSVLILEKGPLLSAQHQDPRRYGDPMGLKSNTWVSLLWPIIDQTDLELWPNCTATHLEAEGARVTRVHFRDPCGIARSVVGDLVIVACSAIESMRLLQLSGELDPDFQTRINPYGLLGAYFLTHCFGGAEAIMPGRFDKSLSLDSDWATDFCASDDFIRSNGLWAGGAIYNNTSDQALPISLARTHGSQDLDTIWKSFVEDTGLTGENLSGWIDANFGTRLSVSFMANQVPLRSNRIELHPTIRDHWGRRVAYIIKDWHSHDRYLMDTLAEQCARVLQFGGDGGQGQYPVNEKGGVYLAENGLVRIANHILGGARFGNDPQDSVLDLMGRDNSITRVKPFGAALQNIRALRQLELAFRENDRDLPFGWQINNPEWDNNYLRSHEQPVTQDPSSSLNTISDMNYFIDFRRGLFLQAEDFAPVRYRNAMMNDDDPEGEEDNIVEMRWLLQRELGGSLVFFHEVTVPPNTVEGTHRHIGTEEIYYIVSGEGIAYMGEHDDPSLSQFPVVSPIGQAPLCVFPTAVAPTPNFRSAATTRSARVSKPG